MECKMHSLLIFVSHQIPYLCPVYEVSLQIGRLKAKGKVLGMREKQHIFVWKSGKYHLRVQSGGISLYYVQWSFLYHYHNNLS